MLSSNRSSIYIALLIYIFGAAIEQRAYALDIKFHQNNEVAITVFIHGSVFSSLALLSLLDVIKDTLSDTSLYVALIKQIRKNQILHEDQLLLQEGGMHIPSTIINQFYTHSFDKYDRKKAAYFIVPAYDAFAQFAGNDIKKDRVYYAFGHLGLLSQRYRRQASKELYHWLCTIIEMHKKQYEKVSVTIVGHSHAGDICWKLAEHEKKYKRALHVDTLITFGAPVQVESIAHVYNDIFGRVINCYSEGDTVQSIDWISTRRRRSYQCFNDRRLGSSIPSHTNHVYDVRLLVNNKRFKIGHANMWLMGRTQAACKSFDPLPVVVLTPLILQQLDASGVLSCHLDCNIVDQKNTLRVQLYPFGYKEFSFSSDNVYTLACTMQDKVQGYWLPDDTTRSCIFNKKTRIALSHGISALYK